MRDFSNPIHTFNRVCKTAGAYPPLAVEFKPFPGKYPTRIVFVIKFKGGKKPVMYSGKPLVAQAEVFYHLSLREDAISASAVEYDRKGMCINYFHSGRGRAPAPFVASWRNEPLMSLYHPWGNNRLFGGLMSQPHVHTLHNGYKFYCPLKTLPMMQQLSVQAQFDKTFPRKNVRVPAKTFGF